MQPASSIPRTAGHQQPTQEWRRYELKLDQLRDRHVEVTTEMKSLIGRANEESRDLTVAEKMRFDTLRDDAHDLARKIEDKEAQEALIDDLADSFRPAAHHIPAGTGEWGKRVAKAFYPEGRKALIASGSVAVPPSFSRDIVTDPMRPQTIQAVVPRQQIDGTNNFAYLRQTVRTNNAAPVTPGDLKPTSIYTIERKEDHCRTVAHLSEPLNRNDLADAQFLMDFVEGELRYGLMLAEDQQILNGDGLSENMTGILATTGVQTQAKGADDLLTCVRKAKTKLLANNFRATALVLHPNDYEDLELLKDSQGRFMMGDPAVSGDAASVWSSPIVVTSAIPQGTGLMADFPMATRLFIREEARIDVSENTSDDFSKNLVRARCESRLGLAVLRPLGAVKLTGI